MVPFSSTLSPLNKLGSSVVVEIFDILEKFIADDEKLMKSAMFSCINCSSRYKGVHCHIMNFNPCLIRLILIKLNLSLSFFTFACV